MVERMLKNMYSIWYWQMHSEGKFGKTCKKCILFDLIMPLSEI